MHIGFIKRGGQVMNIILRELKANRKALIIWCAVMFVFILSGMGKYTAYSAGGASSKVFTEIPYSIKALLGIGQFDPTQMSGYFVMLFVYIELAVAIHAVMLGAGIIAKEERDKTTEFLMIKPVSRFTIITSKLIAGLINIIVVNIVTLFSSIVLVTAYNKGPSINNEIIVFMMSMIIVQLIFFSLGMALAAFMKNPKPSGSLATGILLIAFAVSKITDITDKLNFLNIISPFKYFDFKNIVDGNGLNVWVVIITLALIGIFTVSTYIFYNKRDLHI